MSTPRQVADAMFDRDNASKSLGITVDQVDERSSTLSMTVRDDMVNGLQVCHGGFIFTLADSAMAFASNASDTMAFATFAAVDFLAPGKLGDTLTAHCNPAASAGRTGIWDVTVTNQDSQLVATFRGRTRLMPGSSVLEAAGGIS